MQVKERPWKLLVGAVGVVYGDIGTSPLYALKSSFIISSLPTTSDNIIGLISIFIWLLFLIVTIKYAYLVMNADKSEERGGILVLSNLCSSLNQARYKTTAIVLGILGMALLFGDGVITPAISVLSALEGLHLIHPDFQRYVILLSVVVLTLLFILQKVGSNIIGICFGPIMIIWFFVLAMLGVYNILAAPIILKALNPYYAMSFFYNNGWVAFRALSGAFLVVTGAEALYADRSHFGNKPIQLSWNLLVFPAITLNYLGQGSLLLHSPESIINPFYNMVSSIWLYPLIILATLATIIASQAMISGVFSICWQAIMLDYLPKLRVVHTSNHRLGQVYVPAVNGLLYTLSILAIFRFQTSDRLSFAYGLSVSSVMLITSILISIILFNKKKVHILKLILLPIFIFLDSVFVLTNIIKILEGAWYTLLITVSIAFLIFVWIRNSRSIKEQASKPFKDIKSYILEYEQKFSQRIPGCAIFLNRHPRKTPSSLIIHLRHNKFLHEKIIFLSIIIKEIAFVPPSEKFVQDIISANVYTIKTFFGFKEVPSIDKIISWAEDNQILNSNEEISFFLSRKVPYSHKQTILNKIEEKIYIFLLLSSTSTYEFYKIPHDKAIEYRVPCKVP